MDPLAQNARQYLESIGVPVGGLRPQPTKGFAHYLLDSFNLVQADIAGAPVLLAIERDAHRTPGKVAAKISGLAERTDRVVVYVTPALQAHDRNRLIQRRVAFLVPGNQLYLPQLAMDLREHFRRAPETKVAQPLSPATQALLIAALRRPGWTPEWEPLAAAEALGYSPMTASRAAREIVSTGLANKDRRGRTQVLVFAHPPRQTWEVAQPMLRSPIVRSVYVPTGTLVHRDMRRAGLDALAHQTMLAGSRTQTWAASRDILPSLQSLAEMEDRPDAGLDEWQIWSYPPTIDAGSAWVDPLSLALTLRDGADERVQLELEGLIERAWR